MVHVVPVRGEGGGERELARPELGRALLLVDPPGEVPQQTEPGLDTGAAPQHDLALLPEGDGEGEVTFLVGHDHVQDV